ncbi:hypothetical protein ACFX2B_037560 [Malus domestica]
MAPGEGVAAYGEWTNVPPVRDVIEPLRMLNGSSKKKWRRKPRFLVSTDQVPGNEADGDRPSIMAVEEGRVAEWGTKRGMETQSLELSTSPLKKFRGLGIEETSKVVEQAFLAEEESREVPCEARDMRELLEDFSETDQDQSLENKVGKMARGGGGWPSIATSRP